MRLDGTSGIAWPNFSWQKHSLDKVAQHHKSVQHWGNHHLPGLFQWIVLTVKKFPRVQLEEVMFFFYLLPFPQNSLQKGGLHLLCSFKYWDMEQATFHCLLIYT